MGGESHSQAPDGDALVLRRAAAPGVLVLTLNRPAKANALSPELLSQLSGYLAEARDDDSIACIVLTGSLRVFSAGSDISGMATRGLDWYLDPERLAHWAFIQDYPKPLIAAVNGHALGGGCELAMLCDIIIAGEGALFRQAEIGIGLIPGDGGTQRLPRAVGKSLAMQMILTGHSIEARRALEAGLVSEVVAPDRAVARAVEIGTQIAAHATLSVQLAKRAARAAFELPLSEGLRFERDRVADVFATADSQEGLRAFLEKRQPRYQGR